MSHQDRCGKGLRLPLQVISPLAKRDFVDHSVADQSSILRFFEDNWGLRRIGTASFDAKAGSLDNLFDFVDHHHGHADRRLFPDPGTGQPARR